MHKVELTDCMHVGRSMFDFILWILWVAFNETAQSIAKARPLHVAFASDLCWARISFVLVAIFTFPNLPFSSHLTSSELPRATSSGERYCSILTNDAFLLSFMVET